MQFKKLTILYIKDSGYDGKKSRNHKSRIDLRTIQDNHQEGI